MYKFGGVTPVICFVAILVLGDLAKVQETSDASHVKKRIFTYFQYAKNGFPTAYPHAESYKNVFPHIFNMPKTVFL